MTRITLKETILQLVFMLAAVLVFTFFDWIVHNSWDYLAVPTQYFTHKIAYGTLWAFLASLIFRKQSIPAQAAWITVITVGLLQIMYALYGYPLLFHIVVVTEHLFFMYLATYFSLKLVKKHTKA